ncbi:MAG TPA: S-methyl-5-thioribose-1-phosphate isomerase [Actinobacteria bacterium]|nr:S-methyl-5-thioribose-1-phosphate isomerase [Actinomycetota bacterium]
MRTVEWNNGKVRMIDQTLLPGEEKYIDLATIDEVASAIKTMKVRGAPAIGVTAALGIALAAEQSTSDSTPRILETIRETAKTLGATRPTAVNLFWALDRMVKKAETNREKSAADLKDILVAEALTLQEEDIERNQRLGQFGASLINNGDTLLTHCNAGALACAGFGTALGVIASAWNQGKKIHVFVDETRPLLQGARLTTWELKKAGIPMTLITDNMAGHFMQRGRLDKVVVGADRIAANGDTANKIGTYSVAVLALAHDIPFYVAAPSSTVDLSIPDGDQIVIEERAGREITEIGGVKLAPAGTDVANPAFDVTPSRLVTAIITELGIIYPPYDQRLLASKR